MSAPPSVPGSYDLSVVLPCLNEADTVGQCVQSIHDFFQTQKIQGEIVVADNESTDASARIAASHGARVISVSQRGYGYALREGLLAAQGKKIIMMDCDLSYSAADIPGFLQAFATGADFVQGCRFSAGGGSIQHGAMPLLHRLGTPLFSSLLRIFCRLPLHDVHCGMRGVRRSFLEKMPLQSGGMECTVEILLRARDADAHFAEVPITLHPDGRHTHGPHLRTFRDGYKVMRYVWGYIPRK